LLAKYVAEHQVSPENGEKVDLSTDVIALLNGKFCALLFDRKRHGAKTTCSYFNSSHPNELAK
jgi:hypothetical protein